MQIWAAPAVIGALHKCTGPGQHVYGWISSSQGAGQRSPENSPVYRCIHMMQVFTVWTCCHLVHYTAHYSHVQYKYAYIFYIYIYIYAFSRRFYPKRLTLHSSYSFTFYQLLLSLGIEPMILALLVPCSTIWATGKIYIPNNIPETPNKEGYTFFFL